jgi:hypothetical protein
LRGAGVVFGAAVLDVLGDLVAVVFAAGAAFAAGVFAAGAAFAEVALGVDAVFAFTVLVAGALRVREGL